MHYFFLISLVAFFGYLPLVYAEDYVVDIPFGAYNPELNTPAQVWFDPPRIFITIDDSITWFNQDKEGHTVTSGDGSGRFGWMNDNFGTPDEYFDSGRFMPGESWSFKFEESGVFSYFCVIHPWMEGVIVVEEDIPDYPHDAAGQKLEFPLLMYTPDKNIEVNLTWDPPVIKAHEKIQFVYQFYDPQTNSNLAKMKYNFIIFQNGKEIFRSEGINQIGGDYRNFVFDDYGSIIIRIEGIEPSSILAEESVTVSGSENKAARTVDFTTVVYENPEKTSHEVYHVKPAQRLEFYYELAMVLILVPAALFVYVIFWLKKKPHTEQNRSGAMNLK